MVCFWHHGHAGGVGRMAGRISAGLFQVGVSRIEFALVLHERVLLTCFGLQIKAFDLIADGCDGPGG